MLLFIAIFPLSAKLLWESKLVLFAYFFPFSMLCVCMYIFFFEPRSCSYKRPCVSRVPRREVIRYVRTEAGQTGECFLGLGIIMKDLLRILLLLLENA